MLAGTQFPGIFYFLSIHYRHCMLPILTCEWRRLLAINIATTLSSARAAAIRVWPDLCIKFDWFGVAVLTVLPLNYVFPLRSRARHNCVSSSHPLLSRYFWEPPIHDWVDHARNAIHSPAADHNHKQPGQWPG